MLHLKKYRQKIKRLQIKKIASWLFSLLCLFLVFVDVYQIPNQIGAETLGLLLLVSLPFLLDYVESVKAGGVELTFYKKLSKNIQIFLFLESFAEKRKWTFYKARNDESVMGQGFVFLVEELRNLYRQELDEKLVEWLKSDSINLRFFAAEIIGYFKLGPFKEMLPPHYTGLDINSNWEKWQLNCLWAHSRFNQYIELSELLLKTNNLSNQQWILEACRQMIQSGDEDIIIIKSQLKSFMQRKDLHDEVRASANEAFGLIPQESVN